MKRKSVIEAVIVAVALLGLYGYAAGTADRELGTNSLNTAAAERMEQEMDDMQQGTEEEVIDYTGRDAPASEAEEGGAELYMVDTFSEEDWKEEYERDFYERHRDMDFDGDGEITGYEKSRWDFIHADLEAEIEDLKPLGQQTWYLDRYLSAYMEMDTDEYEQLSLMERADRMDAAYAQMCSDRDMTMDELEEIFETELSAIVQEIRESDPNYWRDIADDMDYWNPMTK